MSDLDDLANAARGRHVVPGRMPPPLSYTSSPPVARRAGWRQRSGARSFAFQLAIVGWTCLMGFFAVYSAYAASHDPLVWAENPRNIRGGPAEMKADAAAMALVCPGAMWFIVALPLGIAAVATYEGGRLRR